MDMRSSIEDTRKGFEASFATGDFYNRQTQDSQHLEKILQFLQVSDGMRILESKTQYLIQFNDCPLRGVGLLGGVGFQKPAHFLC
jgi:hypothetical protein